MPPILRSSPPGKKTVIVPNSGSPSRKLPRCTKCGALRKGHPRQGPCPDPHADSPLLRAATQEPDNDNISEALGSMHIKPLDLSATAIQNRRRRSSVNPRAAVVPDATVASFSTTSLEIVAQMLKPGILSDESVDGEDRSTSIVRWQETLLNASIGKKVKMPGALDTPSPDSSFHSEPAGDDPYLGKEEALMHMDVDASSPSPALTDQDMTTAPNSHRTTPAPLSRSMSMVEREAFIDNLTHTYASKAVIHIVPKLDIAIIQHSAGKIGLHNRVIVENSGDDGWLILGNDEKAVQRLFNRVKAGLDREANVREGGTSGLTVAAGGAIVGGLATFTGLAFS